MKKTIFLFAFLTMNLLANSQNIGIHVGRNLATYTFNKDSLLKLGITNANLQGWALNLPVDFRVNKNLSIHTELGFLQKGFKSVQNIQSGASTLKSELSNYTNYAILPVMVRFHSSGRLLQAYANIGPDASFAINATTKGTTTLGNTSTEVKNTISLDGTKRLALGMQGGAGLKLNLGIVALVLDGRFLTDLKDSQGNFNTQGIKNNAFTTKNWVTSFGVVFGK
jgi:Outer membrane protein beta-barrel domain